MSRRPADACFISTCTPAGAGQNTSQGGPAKQSNGTVQEKAAGATTGPRPQQPRVQPHMSASPSDTIPAHPAQVAGRGTSGRGGLRPPDHTRMTTSRASNQVRSAGAAVGGVADRVGSSQAGMTPQMGDNPVAGIRGAGPPHQSRQPVLTARGQLPAATTAPSAASTMYASSRGITGVPDVRLTSHGAAPAITSVPVARR